MPNEQKRKRARVNVGKDTNGKPVYKWASGYTQKELNAEIRRIEAEYAQYPIANTSTDAATGPSKAAYADA